MLRQDRQPPRGSTAGASLGLLCATLLTLDGCVLAGDREDFLAAEAALKRGDHGTFERLTHELRAYPLYPYLRFAALKGRLDKTSTAEIQQFILEHADSPLAERLRLAWLERLADRAAWREYAQFYREDDSTERRCMYLRALMEIGREAEALDAVEPLWLVGRSQPNACDPVFAAWRTAGYLTTELVWARIALAMHGDRISLARYLGRFLPAGDQRWLERWLKVHASPERVLDASMLPRPHPQRVRLLVHGVKRLAQRSPARAADAWNLIEACYRVPEGLSEQVAAAVGLALADEGDPLGLGYLGGVPARSDNIDVQERRLRAALRLGAWPQVAAWVAAMPDGPHKAEHWLYWQARALEAMGAVDAASSIYAQAAHERSLWGFLAAERLGTAYHLHHQATPVGEERIAAVADSPAGRRIAELRALDRTLDMRREWAYLLRHLEGEDLMAAAVLAQRWGWPDQAIFTLARTGYWDDLALRFPLLHREAVREGARLTGLDDSWIYAILRQESAFNPLAVSSAGAFGLMQLMPSTARAMAKVLDLPRTSRSQLLQADNNIALGSAYLARMHRRFNDNPVLAAAAYNAGPGNVDRWLPAQPVDADIWIATIPFRETRAYVRRVLAYRLIYDHRLERPIKPLSEMMRAIGHTATLTGANSAESVPHGHAGG